MPRLPPETIQEIRKRLKENKSQYSIHKDLGVSFSAINRQAKALNLTAGERLSQTKRALEVKAAYDRARRIELGDKLMRSIERALEEYWAPIHIQQLSVAYGILCDKRTQDEAAGVGRSKIDELIERMETAAGEPESEGVEV